MKEQKIAFVSCAYAEKREVQPAWKPILDLATDPDPQRRLDLLLLLGDTAYMNWAGGWNHDALDRCYARQFDVPEFRQLISKVPVLAIWDDHDCGIDNVCGAMYPEEVRRSRELFDKWMGFAANAGRPEMYGTYDELPGIRILMLDGRTHRTPPTAPGATMLGAEQEAWLWQELARPIAGQRPITIVANGVGLSEGGDDEIVDAYGGFSTALRDRLAFRADGPHDPGRRGLYLAGDIHRNFFKTHEDGRIHEAISSGVACFRPKTYVESDFVPERHADNWGLLRIDDSRVRIEFHAVKSKSNNFTKVVRRADWMVEGD